jgi:hypothetical protein
VARAGAKASRDDVRSVAGFASGAQDSCLYLGRDPHLLASTREHEGRRGLGDAGAAGDVSKRDPDRPHVYATSALSLLA